MRPASKARINACAGAGVASQIACDSTGCSSAPRGTSMLNITRKSFTSYVRASVALPVNGY